MRVLSRADVQGLLTAADVIDTVHDTFLRVGTDEVHQPVRTVLRVPGRSGVFGVMPAHLGPPDTGSYGVKTVVVDPANAGRGLDTHVGVVTVFDPVTGVPQAVLEAGSVTALRTAAASAVATRALVADPRGELAMIGAGVQARLHLVALAGVMDVTRATVWSRSPESVRRLLGWAADALPFEVVARPSVAAATADASVVCTVTGSSDPLLARADLRPGTHVNAVGACFPNARELAGDLVRAARVVVDVEQSARRESGDLLLASPDGTLPPVVELGAVLRGQAVGRRTPEEITVFESLGFAALDVAAGRAVYELATTCDAGTEVALG